MNYLYLIALTILIAGSGCGSQQTAAEDGGLGERLTEKNRMNISLLDQIRQLPGVSLRKGVPVFTKVTSDIYGGASFEPLYVLDGYTVGNSFRDVDQLVSNIHVEKIETLTGHEASFYGARGSNGVIVITTKK